MNSGWQRELRFAHELANLADAVTLPAFRAGLPVETKADGTPVTSADRDTERALRTAIRSTFPDHAVLGEEDGLDGPEGAPRWILDPVDGTTNFVLGIPVFATLIALEVDGQPVAGVVSAPALGSRWDGVSGGPAHQDRREIRVSEVASLDRAHVLLGGLGYFARRGLDGFVDRLARASARQRGFGDFWQHCLVASGAAEVAVEAEVSIWDLAAVQAVVEAAGGRFSSLSGQRTASGGDALSTNGLLHDAVLELLDESQAEPGSTS